MSSSILPGLLLWHCWIIRITSADQITQAHGWNWRHIPTEKSNRTRTQRVMHYNSWMHERVAGERFEVQLISNEKNRLLQIHQYIFLIFKSRRRPVMQVNTYIWIRNKKRRDKNRKLYVIFRILIRSMERSIQVCTIRDIREIHLI